MVEIKALRNELPTKSREEWKRERERYSRPKNLLNPKPKPKPSPVVKKSFWLIKTSIMRNNLTASLATLFHFSLRCCLHCFSSMCRHFGFDCLCCPADQTDSTQGNCCRAVSLSPALSLLFSLAWVRNYNALVMPDKKRNIKRKRTSIFGKHVWRQRGNALISLSLFFPLPYTPACLPYLRLCHSALCVGHLFVLANVVCVRLC